MHPEDLAAEITPQAACRVCGQVGWEAHFRAQQPGWYENAKRDGTLAQMELSGEQAQALESSLPAHEYNPGGPYVSWADYKYGWPHKAYIHGLHPREPSLIHCIGSGSSADRPDWGGNWIRAENLTTAQKKIIASDGMNSRDEFEGWYLLEPKRTLFAKFYSVHLADARISSEASTVIQRASGVRFEFTDDGRVRWGPWAESAGSGS